MKAPFILSFFLVCLFASGCRKDSDANAARDITGRWELRYVFDGMVVPDPSATVPGNGTIYTFKDHRFTYSQNHAPVDSGTYTTLLKKQPVDNIPMSFIAFNAADTLIYNRLNDTLILYPIYPTTDGYYRRFVRIDK